MQWILSWNRCFLSKDSLVSMVPSFLCVRHGHESMRLKSSVHGLQNHEVMVTKVQAEGKDRLDGGRKSLLFFVMCADK